MRREDWARIPTCAPYVWELWRHGSLALAEVHPGSDEDTPFTKAQLMPPPYAIVAQPLRVGLPKHSVAIIAGQVPLWMHVDRILMSVSGGEPILFSYVCFGHRDLVTGAERVWTVFPDGAVEVYASLEAAFS